MNGITSPYNISVYSSTLENVAGVRANNDTKTFLAANETVQRDILKGMQPQAKEALLESIREHYQTGYPNCSAAIKILSINMIKSMPAPGNETDPAKIYVINILKFMNKYIKKHDDIPENQRKNRDAAAWPGEKALAEGNSNGCVEASRIFLSLLRGVDTNIKAKYVSSFSEKGAMEIKEELAKPFYLQNQDIIKDPPGHAVIEVMDQTGTPFLVDASMFKSTLLGINVSAADLEGTTDVGDKKVNGRVPQPGQYDLWIRKEGNIFKTTEYPGGQFGKNGVGNSFKSLDELNKHLKKYDTSPSFSDLEKENIIKHEKDGGFEMEAREYSGKYIIFDKQYECPFTSQSGPSGSSTTTLEAIIFPWGIKPFADL